MEAKNSLQQKPVDNDEESEGSTPPEPLTLEQSTKLLAFVEDVFGPNGALVKGGRSYRSQQHTFARSVAQSFIQAKPGMYEAGTGTGKSFGYLACVLWVARHTGRRTIIAVSTNSLLDQIYKDIPVLMDILKEFDFKGVTYGQLKGRTNYVCQDMRDESIYKLNNNKLRLDSADDWDSAERLLSWAQEGTDLTHYDDSPPQRVVRLATINGTDCKERRDRCQYALPFFCENCQMPLASPFCDTGDNLGQTHRVIRHGTRCYFMTNRRKCFEASIVVTNLNLLLLNHSMKQVIFGKLDYIILDEAHEVNAKVRDEFSQETALAVFDKAAERLRKLTSMHNDIRLRLRGDKAAEVMEDVAGRLRTEMVKYAKRRDFAGNRGKEIEALVVKGFDSEKLFSTSAELVKAAIEAREVGELLGDKGKGEEPAKSNVFDQAESVHEALSFGNPNEAVGVGVSDKYDGAVRPKLITIPVDVGGFVKASIHSEGIVIAVSATLTTDGHSWSLPRKQLGMPDDALTCAVDSPFNYAQNCAVYIPGTMPASHMRKEYNAAASNEAAKIVDVMGGKTLVLCSAKDDIEVARSAIAELGFEVMTQGMAPPRELARRFKENASSCLVGSKTFGTGFDVPGEALECTILWKLPFAKQSLVDEFLKKRDGEGVWRGAYYVPAMLLELRQWVGRLIRQAGDIGVIVILDTMKVAQLKKQVLPALPKGARILREIEEIEGFMFNAKMSAGVTPLARCNWCGRKHEGGPEACVG